MSPQVVKAEVQQYNELRNEVQAHFEKVIKINLEGAIFKQNLPYSWSAKFILRGLLGVQNLFCDGQD
ncbi:hypothetical protein BGS_0289 [Beggiatoa sp. SS]|nr:hypothetical protein BGS_0289 [Beggiatoa sp. SS]